MRISGKIFVTTTLLVSGTAAFSQDQVSHCNALLQHGISDVSTRVSSEEINSYKWNKYCRGEVSEESDNFYVQAEAEIFDLFGGSGSNSSSNRKRRVVEWCEEGKDIYSDRFDDFRTVQALNQHALDAWNQCQEFAKKDIDITARVGPNPVRNVSFSIDSTFDGDLFLTGVYTKGFTCQTYAANKNGSSVDLRALVYKDNEAIPAEQSGRIVIENENIHVNCTRDAVELSDVPNSGAVLRFEEGVISINTTSSNFVMFFREVVDTYYATPPASVIAFHSNFCPSGWQPYEPAFGRFVRGVDLSGDGVDPSGKRQPGSTQGDAFQTHQHSLGYHAANSVGSRPHENFEYPRSNNNNRTLLTTDIVGGRHEPSETRPKNVALLYCIRGSEFGELQP